MFYIYTVKVKVKNNSVIDDIMYYQCILLREEYMPKNKMIQDLVSKIEDKIYQNESIHLEDIEKISGYSKRYTQLIFKEITGLTISNYIKKRRLSKAAILIRLTRKSIFHISMELNFHSLQSFTRAFSREFKITPLKYRKNIFFDCSNITPPFSLKKQNYKLSYGHIGPITLNYRVFELKESLLQKKSNRTKKIRKREVFKITHQKDNVFIVTNLIAYSKMENTVILKTLIGEKVKQGNFKIDKTLCRIVTFEGTWDEYCIFSQFIIGNINVKIGNTIIEEISKSTSIINDEQFFFIRVYFPLD